MNKVNGIKSIDFKVTAIGNGVVNWNGTTETWGKKKDGKTIVNNHLMPKLRGYSNKEEKEENDKFNKTKTAQNIDFKETPMYVSQNCIRHHLFKDQSHDMHFAAKKGTDKDPRKLLISLSGLLRGYVIPSSQCKRKSPLLIEDFVDQLGNGNFEQFANIGEKDNTSIFSKTTFGKTHYIAHGSISVEDLQFISLDYKFDRAALVTVKNIIKQEDEIKKMTKAEKVKYEKDIVKYEKDIVKYKEEGVEIAKELESFISSLSAEKGDDVKVEYGDFIRVGTMGSIYNEPEKGLLLNNTAIEILVDIMLEMIEELSIKQAKGWLSVSSLDVDYNDSKSMMRIVKNPEEINELDEEDAKNFAVYYKKL